MCLKYTHVRAFRKIVVVVATTFPDSSHQLKRGLEIGGKKIA
jgi:hypothetical protein